MKVSADIELYTVEVKAIATVGLGFIFLPSKLFKKIQVYNFLEI